MRDEIVGGVFLVILLTINGSSGMPDLATRGLANEAVWEAILYGYVVDPDSPSYLSRGDRIFKVTTEAEFNELIAISPASEMLMEFEYSDSEHTAANNLASSLSVSGSYGAFSAAASMQVSKTSDSSIKTVRMDAMTKAILYEVGSKNGLSTYPENYLTDNFINAVQSLTVEEIEERIGVFYATKMDLGGELRKSYTMQATSEDNELSVSAELTAAYGTAMMDVSATASIGVSSRTTNADSQMNIEWSAKGGNTLVWLGKTFGDSEDTSVSSIQREWAQTINDDNLYSFNFELGLMWELVKHVDLGKGNDFQQYLESKWEANNNQFHPNKFLPRKLTRNDRRCGDEYRLSDGTPAQCKSPECCSKEGRCGEGATYCENRGKECTNVYTRKSGKCNGWNNISKATCVQYCKSNRSPSYSKCPRPSGGCRYAVWSDNRDWNGWCQLAGVNCGWANDSKKTVVDINAGGYY